MRRITLAAPILFALSTLITAQSPAPATFEVASVKVSPKQSRGGPRPMAEITLPPVRVLPGGRVESYGHTLRNLIAAVYDINTLMQKMQIMMRSVTGLGAPLSGPDAPQLLDVFRDELGLTLVKDRATINDYIIERVEPLIEI